jgi:hypothetical protein
VTGSLAALAQAAPTGRVILLIGLAIAALLVFGLLALALRRRLFAGADAEPGEAFDMDTLQRQHKAGLISDEEFRTLRRALLGLPPEAAQAPGPAADSEADPDEQTGERPRPEDV